jgi:hypothetical protein
MKTSDLETQLRVAKLVKKNLEKLSPDHALRVLEIVRADIDDAKKAEAEKTHGGQS